MIEYKWNKWEYGVNKQGKNWYYKHPISGKYLEILIIVVLYKVQCSAFILLLMVVFEFRKGLWLYKNRIPVRYPN